MLRLSNFRIGTKLAVISGLAIVLVIGMAVSQYMSGGRVDALNFQQDLMQSVRSKVKDAQAAILHTWIARRDGLLAKTVPQIEASLTAMHASTELGQKQIDKSIEGSAPKDRERLKQLKTVFDAYVASAEAQLNAQKDLLLLRQRQLDTTQAWDKAFGSVAASPDYADPEILAAIRDGVSFMKDARIAYWRYSTMLDDQFVAIMHNAADRHEDRPGWPDHRHG